MTSNKWSAYNIFPCWSWRRDFKMSDVCNYVYVEEHKCEDIKLMRSLILRRTMANLGHSEFYPLHEMIYSVFFFCSVRLTTSL